MKKMTTQKKITVFEEIKSLFYNNHYLKWTAIVMIIALIAFVGANSYLNNQPTAPNNPSNNKSNNYIKKPEFEDLLSQYAELNSKEGTLKKTGQPRIVRTILTGSGSTALKVYLDKGYYNIRTSCDNGLIGWILRKNYCGDIKWVLKDGENELAHLYNCNNNVVIFDKYFAEAKDYQLEIGYSVLRKCNLIIKFEPTTGRNSVEKFFLDLDKNYPNQTYPHVFRKQYPEPDSCFIGSWGAEGELPEIRTTLIFTYSQYGEYRKDHKLSIYEVNVNGLDYSRRSRIIQRPPPEDYVWDLKTPINPHQFKSTGHISVIVRLKDEDGHIYDNRWEFRWYSSFPIATGFKYSVNEKNEITAITFFTDREFDTYEQDIIGNSIVSVSIGGQQFTIKNLNVLYSYFPFSEKGMFTIELPKPRPRHIVYYFDKYPFSIEVIANQDIKEKYHLPDEPLQLVSPTFWKTVPKNLIY